MAAFDKDEFIDSCVERAFSLAVWPEYVLAVAQARSGMTDKSGGTELGPFGLTQAQWDANLKDPDGVKDFKSTQIKNWRMHCQLFPGMVSRDLAALQAKLGRDDVSFVELYCAEFPGITPAKATGDLTAALIITVPLAEAALKKLGQNQPVINDPTKPVGSGSSGPIQLDFLTAGQRSMADKIIKGFEAAGCTLVAQAAALANAMAESSLDPNRVNTNPPEHSVGLFQCNINGGVGSGKTEEFLKNPDNNIKLILEEVERRAPTFKAATDLKAAVTLFVKEVERPANAEAEAAKRMTIALKFLPA